MTSFLQLQRFQNVRSLARAGQIYRIHYGENLLRTFPEYATYAAANWRMLPFVW